MDSQAVASVLDNVLVEAFINLIVFMVLIGFAHVLGTIVGNGLGHMTRYIRKQYDDYLWNKGQDMTCDAEEIIYRKQLDK